MDYDAIESSPIHNNSSRVLGPLNVFLDFWDGNRSRDDAGIGGLDSGWTDWDNVQWEMLVLWHQHQVSVALVTFSMPLILTRFSA